MLVQLYPPIPFLIRGHFLGLVWHEETLSFLRLLESGQEIQIALPYTLECIQLFELQTWDSIQIEGVQIGDPCQSERLLRAYSIRQIRSKQRLFVHGGQRRS